MKIEQDILDLVSRILGIVEKNNGDVNELKNQIGINCKKLDSMDKKLDSIVEIVTANGQGIEVLSSRIDKLE